MAIKTFLKTYALKALIPASIYCITVIIFLIKADYTSIWILFVGNVLYMIFLAVLIYTGNRSVKFEASPLTSTFGGHILSLTGAAIAVVFSLILYFVFDFATHGSRGEVLQGAPGSFSTTASHQMLFVLVLITALGNTVSGFLAALLMSFDITKKLPS